MTEEEKHENVKKLTVEEFKMLLLKRMWIMWNEMFPLFPSARDKKGEA